MKMNKNLSKFLILLALFIGICLLIYTKGSVAIKGLFWGANFSDVYLLVDKIKCNTTKFDCFSNTEDTHVNFGVYDFTGTFGENDNLAFEHYFFDWNDTSFVQKLPELLKETNDKNRWPLLTVEPFNMSNSTDLFKDIDERKYDQVINDICISVENSKTPVFLRWGHEMERVTGRYPWALEDMTKYISGYNYFATKCKESTDNAYFVWSPAGEDNLNLYWPGYENVDYVGLSLYIYDKYELETYGKVRNFSEAFSERYNKVTRYEKPVMLAEFGVSLSTGDAKHWWFNAFKQLNKFDQLKTIIYFNAIDTHGVWGKYPTPNWSISNKIFPEISN